MYRIHLNQSIPTPIPCPTASPTSVPYPFTNTEETGAVAVQDGAAPQIIINAPAFAPGTNIYANAFDRLLPPLSNTISVVPATPTPPGFTGSTVPPNAFSGVQVTTTDRYDISTGFSLASATTLTGILAAEILVFPGGIGTSVPLSIGSIPISFSTFSAGSLARGSTRLTNIPLTAGDVVQIQFGLPSPATLTILYSFLEIE